MQSEMKKSLQTELWKATHNRMFYVTLLIGMLLMALNVCFVNNSMLEFQERIAENLEKPSFSPQSFRSNGYSLFMQAAMFSGGTISAAAFYLVWPILAAMPYADAYAQEHRTGISSQLIARTSPRTYFLSKYVAIFVVGGLVVMLPLLADLLACALIAPSNMPGFEQTDLSNNYFLSQLFFTHPWGYAVAWLPIIFLWGGVTAGLALLAGDRFRNKVFVLLFPFAVYCVLGVVYPLCSPTLQVVPLDMVRAAPDHPTSALVIFGYAAIIMAITLFFGYRQVKKNEIL